jgi:hypothetical protein
VLDIRDPVTSQALRTQTTRGHIERARARKVLQLKPLKGARDEAGAPAMHINRAKWCGATLFVFTMGILAMFTGANGLSAWQTVVSCSAVGERSHEPNRIAGFQAHGLQRYK